MQITFHPDGTAEHVGETHLLDGSVASRTKRRASHIEPLAPDLRVLFHLCRWIAGFLKGGEESWLAAWTRRWPCIWRVRIVDGPTLGCYADRQQAIRDEIEWLEKNRL
jgi:hypothetical protein